MLDGLLATLERMHDITFDELKRLIGTLSSLGWVVVVMHVKVTPSYHASRCSARQKDAVEPDTLYLHRIKNI